MCYASTFEAWKCACAPSPRARGLQRERSDGDRAEGVRHELLNRLQKMGLQLPGMFYQYRLRPDGTSYFPYASEGIRQVRRRAGRPASG
jgi:hypothetical protein